MYNGARGDRGASHFEGRDDHDGSCRAHWRSSDAAASVRRRLVERDLGADDHVTPREQLRRRGAESEPHRAGARADHARPAAAPRRRAARARAHVPEVEGPPRGVLREPRRRRPAIGRHRDCAGRGVRQLVALEEHFRATGSGLGGGSGWVMLSFELDTGSLRTAWSGHHTQALATGFPLLVMDMYEHSYQMDFGAAVPRYLDAFFANVQWDEVNARFERAQRLRAAL